MNALDYNSEMLPYQQKPLYVLVGCEESQSVTIELRKLGIQAFSCDLKACSGGHPEWHLHCDVFRAITGGVICTQDGTRQYVESWHGLIVHPECTYLTVSGLHWNGRVEGRAEKTEQALQFVCDLLNCGIPHIRLENPVGCISTRIEYNFKSSSFVVVPIDYKSMIPFKPSEIVQPYQFGEDASKKTCFWNIDFPNLVIDPANYFQPRIVNGKERWSNQTDSGQNKLTPSPERTALRSKTYTGIAQEIAKSTSDYLTSKY